MAHDLELQSNGKHSFVAAREDAWHHLGKVYTHLDGLTLDQVLADLNVGEIITEPVYSGIAGIPFPNKKMTIRVRPTEQTGGVAAHSLKKFHNGQWFENTPLGIVGEDYTVIDEKTAFEFTQNLASISGAMYETAGLLGERGQQAFATLRFPNGVKIGGVDPVDLYLVTAFSHDGSLAYSAMATPIRVVCRNTLNWAVKGAVRKFRLRHTKHADKAMEVAKAQKALSLSFAYFGNWAQEAEKLINVVMTDLQFEEIVSSLYDPDNDGATGSKRADTVFAQRVEVLEKLWEGPTVGQTRNTAWGALQALTEEVDWFRGVRNVPEHLVQGHMFERSVFDVETETLKNKIHAAVVDFAHIGV